MRSLPYRKRSGQAALMVTLCLPVSMGMLGLVVDVGWSYWRTEACRTAAEAAAMAAALQAKDNYSGTSFSCGTQVACTSTSTTYVTCPSSPSSPASDNLQTGCLYAKQNGFTYGGNSNRQNVRYAAGTTGSPITTNSPDYWVRFVVAERIPTLFSAVLGQPWMNVSARSTAGVYKPAGACVYALGTQAATGISLGGGATVSAGCGVWDNSTNTSGSLSCSNNTTLSGGTAGITLGGASGCPQATPTPTTNQPAATDPFANVQTPPDMNRCDSTGIDQNSHITMPADGVFEVCNGGMSMNANKTLTLPAGLYYLKNGTISWQNGTVNGTGVTIYLAGPSVSGISINGNVSVNLSAPTSGPYDGLVIYQNRNLTSPPSHSMNGGSTMLFQGTIYLPGSYVSYSGGNGTNITALVANQINFTGNSTFGTDTTGSLTGLPIVAAYMLE